MSSYVSSLRNRGHVAATYEAVTTAGNQHDQEVAYDYQTLVAFLERSGIKEEDIKRELPSKDGSWIEIDVLSNTLSVQKALQSGASSAWVIYHPADSTNNLTRIRLQKSWFLSRNFGKPFQVVVLGSLCIILLSAVYIAIKLFGYDNSLEIVVSNFKTGLGLD